MTPFNNLFWGFILILLDFRIQGLDIIPDFIGYWKIYSGLKDLVAWNFHFEKAKKLVVPLGFLSILDIYQVQRPINEISFEPIFLVFILIGIIVSIIDLFMVFHICKGISEIAEERGEDELSEKAMNRWQWYLYVKLAFLILTPLMFISTDFAMILGIPLLLVTLSIAIMLAILMKDADKYFAQQ